MVLQYVSSIITWLYLRPRRTVALASVASAARGTSGSTSRATGHPDRAAAPVQGPRFHRARGGRARASAWGSTARLQPRECCGASADCRSIRPDDVMFLTLRDAGDVPRGLTLAQDQDLRRGHVCRPAPVPHRRAGDDWGPRQPPRARAWPPPCPRRRFGRWASRRFWAGNFRQTTTAPEHRRWRSSVIGCGSRATAAGPPCSARPSPSTASR